jgi:hypothetical protein
MLALPAVALQALTSAVRGKKPTNHCLLGLARSRLRPRRPKGANGVSWSSAPDWEAGTDKATVNLELETGRSATATPGPRGVVLP